MRRIASLDARQRELAKRLIAFRQKLLKSAEDSKPPRQLMMGMRQMDNALATLRSVAKQLRRFDNQLFVSVTDTIKSLQGDLTNRA